MVDSIHTKIERDRKAAAPEGTKWDHIRTYRSYARGRNQKTLNADQLRILSGVLKHSFSDNVLKMILWEHANRVRLSRFDVEDNDVSDFLFDLWVKNQFPDMMADSVFSTLRDGNHAVSLDWRVSDSPSSVYGGRVTVRRERWWDGREGVFVMYGDDGEPVYAVKEWTPIEFVSPVGRVNSGNVEGKRRNIYYPDRILRFRWVSGEWKMFNFESDVLAVSTSRALVGPVEWTKRDGSPLGIPIVHFPNGSDDDSLYGSSLLSGGPLAFQDQINAIQHDITSAAMLNGSPQTYSSGFELPKKYPNTSSDERVPVKTGPGTHHHTDENTAKWGIIEGGNITPLREAYGLKVEALCRDTQTPYYIFTGQWPSGAALFRADLPLTGASRKLIDSLGPATSTIAHRATEIVNTFGFADLDEDALITSVFEPPEQIDAISRWEIADKASAHVSRAEVLRIANYSPEKIEAILDEIDEDSERSISVAQAGFMRPADLDTLQKASGTKLTDEDEQDPTNEDK